jgi:hypothetical protein
MFIGIIADVNLQVNESNEANNTASTPITIAAQQPDLIVINLSVTPTTVAAGGSVTVSFTIFNQGSGTAGTATHQVRLSSDSNITTGDVFLDSVTTGVLSSGISQSFTRTVTIPGGTASGTMFIGIIADVNLQVNESNEANNTASTPITIGPSAQDEGEPNNSPQGATLVNVPPPGQSTMINGNGAPGDAGTTITQVVLGQPFAGCQRSSVQDWFRLVVSQRDSFEASLSFQGANVNFDLLWYIETSDFAHFPQGAQLLDAAEQGPGQQETLRRVVEPGTYFIAVTRVTSGNSQRISYTLTLTRGASPELQAIEDAACVSFIDTDQARNGHRVVNRIRPTQYPARLESIIILLGQAQGQPSPAGRPVRVFVFTDPSGSGTPPFNPSHVFDQTVTVAAAGFNTLNLGGSGPVINQGDFYVGYVIDTSNAMFLNLGRAIYPSLRSFFSSNGGQTYQQLDRIVDGTPTAAAIRATINTRPFGKVSATATGDGAMREDIRMLRPRVITIEP